MIGKLERLWNQEEALALPVMDIIVGGASRDWLVRGRV